MNQVEVMKQALEALIPWMDSDESHTEQHAAYHALRQAIEQDEAAEPDAIGCACVICDEWQQWTPSGMVCKNGHGGAAGVNYKLYTHPTAPAQPAEPQGWREFVEGIAAQKPEKPDYWSSCSQCERNASDAEDLLSAAPAQPTFVKHEVESAEDWSEWVCPDPDEYLIKCCDCGLVHEAQFRVAEYKPTPSEEFVVTNNPNMQAQFRMKRHSAPAQPLTDEQIAHLWAFAWTSDRVAFIRAIEAAHGITGETK